MSTSNSTTAMRIGAIALIVLAYWYWSTPSTPKSSKTDKSSKKTITTTTTTTVITTEEKTKTGSSQKLAEDSIDSGAIATDSRQDAIETADDTNNIILAEDSSTEKLEEPLVTVEVVAREISNETAETIAKKIEETITNVVVAQKDEVIVEEIVDDSTVSSAAINDAEEEGEEQEESIAKSIIGTVELTTSELTDTDALVAETEAEFDDQVQDLAQENDREELTDTAKFATEVATEAAAESVTETAAEVDATEVDTVEIAADIADETDILEEEEEEEEDPIDEFESVMVYEIISPSTSFNSFKELQKSETLEVRDQVQEQDDNDEAHESALEREMPASKLETIQTPTKEESNLTTEESDQADTPTTLVGEELEMTKDTLQTLQEVSRVAKHSELNARAQEFKPSWLASPQQVAPISRPEVPQDTASAKSVIKLKSRCHYWPNCTNKACKYTHPSQPCRDGDNCRFGDRCIFIHPKDQTTPRSKKGPKQSAASHGRRPSSATMTSVSPIEPSWGRV
ncbi:hypothetical protein BGX26_010504 [Mortierella sp. AD094]|nr:hypothetical protein BGX26_010504 [Mortierella sp. AD094]